MSKNCVVIGAQWGDEGKGKIVDLLTEQADVIARFQGGNNAGHTLVVGDQKVILHLIPSGVLHPGKKCLIGNGVVLDPEVFCKELDHLMESGVNVGPEDVRISNKTHLIMPYHREMDKLREMKKSGKDKIGTTGRGIGPAYEDKVARVGIRACDILDPDFMQYKIEKALTEKNVLFQHYFGTETMSREQVWEQVRYWAERIRPYLSDVSGEIQQARNEGKSILYEGAQGVHLDIDHGTYPFVTSSNTVAANASTGSGSGLDMLDRVVAVVKAYTTRVGSGPFPAELSSEVGRHIQEKGDEFGATTGRERRCGWLDLVMLRESVRLSGASEIALTKLDVLSGLEQLHLCTAYMYNQEEIKYPPQIENGLEAVEPVYKSLDGWSEDVSKVQKWEDLPLAAKNYLQAIEEETGVKVSIVSVGPDRESTLRLD